jgi:hypothetical protein
MHIINPIFELIIVMSILKKVDPGLYFTSKLHKSIVPHGSLIYRLLVILYSNNIKFFIGQCWPKLRTTIPVWHFCSRDGDDPVFIPTSDRLRG